VFLAFVAVIPMHLTHRVATASERRRQLSATVFETIPDDVGQQAADANHYAINAADDLTQQLKSIGCQQTDHQRYVLH